MKDHLMRPSKRACRDHYPVEWQMIRAGLVPDEEEEEEEEKVQQEVSEEEEKEEEDATEWW